MSAIVFWADYGYNAGRSKPVPVKHCQDCHDEHMASLEAHRARGGTVRDYSVRLRPSEKARCRTCGASCG